MSESLETHVWAQEVQGTDRPASSRPSGLGSVGRLAPGSVEWRQALGGGLIALGVIAIIIAWYGVSGTLDPGRQMPYLASGGVGGGALVVLGVTLLVSFEHARDRGALEAVLGRLDELDARIEALRPAAAEPAPKAGTGNGNGRARSKTVRPRTAEWSAQE